MRKPMPHQRDGLRRFLAKSRLGLFWEMRLGKSLVAVRWAESKRPENVLLVAPLTVLPSWQAELRLEGLTSHVLRPSGSRPQQPPPDGCRWFLTNYETVRNHPELCDVGWDVVIADESTRIRNPQAQVTKVFVNRLAPQSLNRAVLSGLPNPEGPSDFFTQMAFLDGRGRFMGHGNFWEWRNEHFQKVRYDWVPKVGTIEAVKEQVRARAHFLTRKKAGVGSKVVRETVTVTLPQNVRAAYRRAEADWVLGERTTKWSPVVATYLARLAGGACPDFEHSAKMEALRGLVVDGDLKREQAVVWFRFNSELFAVYDACKKWGVSAVCVYGSVPNAERERRRLLFQKGKARLLLAQAKCALYGLDCSAADTAIYYSRWYDLEVNAQSRDRIVHPKKTWPLLEVSIVAENTVDEDVEAALLDKRVNAAAFKNTILKSMLKRKEGV